MQRRDAMEMLAGRLGILGDVHCEDVALNAARALFAEQGTSRVLAVGDLSMVRAILTARSSFWPMSTPSPEITTVGIGSRKRAQHLMPCRWAL